MEDSRQRKLTSKDIADQAEVYCSKTSIHGLKYIGDVARPLWERTIWLIIFLISLTANVYLISETYLKWINVPVVVTFKEKASHVNEFPFPAVTVCTNSKIKRTIFDYAKLVAEVEATYFNKDEQYVFNDSKVQSMFEDANLLCEDYVDGYDGIKNVTNSSTIDFFLKVNPKLEDTISYCKYPHLAVQVDCRKKFETIITREGICFSLNMLMSKDIFTGAGKIYPSPERQRKSLSWNLENGYFPDVTRHERYPFCLMHSGAESGLVIEFKQNRSDFEYKCQGPVQSYKVFLHSPIDIPNSNDGFFKIPLNHDVGVIIKPRITTTSEGLRSASPESRMCYYPNEKQLKYFKNYTQSNCDIECVRNQTMENCGCVPHYMPRTEDEPICAYNLAGCFINAEEEANIGFSKDTDKCNCLPDCIDIDYVESVTQTKLITDDKSDIVTTKLTIYYSDSYFTGRERRELFALVDFFAYCGGQLGLFLGFSVLSLFELFYHSSLRLYNNLRMKKSESQDAEEEEQVELKEN